MPPETDDPNLTQVTQNMSEVNQDALNQEEENTAENTASPAAGATKGKTDRQGRTFDPAFHEVDPATQLPRINRDGFLACKPGRPGKFQKARTEKTGGAPQEKIPTPESPASPGQNHNMARITTALFIKVGIGIFGEEWAPQVYKIQDVGTFDEQAELQAAFDQYFRSRNMKDLTPGWTLVLTLGGYAAARMTKPTTQDRFKLLAVKAGSFAVKIFGKVTGFLKKIFKGVKRAPQPDLGNNGERQDDASAETRATVQS